jgi:Leucine-rich repeat (LRR) protein
MVFFFGVYDDYVSFDSTLVKQIQHILYLECNDINFYPKKISKYNLDLGLMKRYIAEYRVLDQPRIDCKKKVMQLERRAKCLVAINDDDCLDLTSSYDGFTNILETLELNETILTLKSLLMLSYHGDFICNRIDLADFDFNGIFSKYIRKIYFKSCKINHTPFLNDFKNLELINFSANYVSVLDFFNFPNGLKRINFSKNRIDLVIVNNDSTYEKIESLSLFNNKISEFSWLSSMKNIRYLNLGMNPVKDFPLEILGLEKIEHINLALTEIKCIPNEIIYMESLRVLDVKNCPNMNLSDSIFEKLKTKGVQLIC